MERSSPHQDIVGVAPQEIPTVARGSPLAAPARNGFFRLSKKGLPEACQRAIMEAILDIRPDYRALVDGFIRRSFERADFGGVHENKCRSEEMMRYGK